MASKTALKQWIEAAEVAARINTRAPDGCLPVIVSEDDMNGAAAREQREQGYVVMTFEQLLEMMI